jgi:hypothetical protein
MQTKSRRSSVVPIPRSRAIGGWLALSFVIPFAFLLILSSLDVQLGQGYFFFRYSQLRSIRTMRALPMVPIAGVFCGSVWMLSRAARARRLIGFALFFAALIGTGAWAWWAPPQPLTQNMFNMTSLSTDGSFYIEASEISSLTEYLRHFPDRLRMTPAQLGGTRVLSNPPGTTILAYAVRRWFSSSPDHLGWLDRQIMSDGNVSPAEAPQIANPLRFGIALMVLWVLSGFAAYGLGRVFLSRAGAVVFATIVTFNPCTMNFVPGKDPAQLLTINLMLWAWLAGWKSRRAGPMLCAIAGALLVIGSLIGLVHIWVAAITLGATIWNDWRCLKQLLVRNVIPAIIGAIVICAIAWLAIGWNIPLTLRAVSHRWSELQGTFAMNRAIWYLIGLPIFLLFLSPGVWLLLGLSIRRPRVNSGTRLAICTAAAMAIVYIGFGVTYELPRLWVAFWPTMVLGLAMDCSLLRGNASQAEHRRISKVLMLVVLTQVAFTAFHWTFLDARETEYRLISHRFYH